MPGSAHSLRHFTHAIFLHVWEESAGPGHANEPGGGFEASADALQDARAHPVLARSCLCAKVSAQMCIAHPARCCSGAEALQRAAAARGGIVDANAAGGIQLLPLVLRWNPQLSDNARRTASCRASSAPLLSILLAIFTVSPMNVNLTLRRPMAAAMAGPEWMPTRMASFWSHPGTSSCGGSGGTPPKMLFALPCGSSAVGTRCSPQPSAHQKTRIYAARNMQAHPPGTTNRTRCMRSTHHGLDGGQQPLRESEHAGHWVRGAILLPAGHADVGIAWGGGKSRPGAGAAVSCMHQPRIRHTTVSITSY